MLRSIPFGPNGSGVIAAVSHSDERFINPDLAEAKSLVQTPRAPVRGNHGQRYGKIPLLGVFDQPLDHPRPNPLPLMLGRDLQLVPAQGVTLHLSVS